MMNQFQSEVKKLQKAELLEREVYLRITKRMKPGNNRDKLLEIAASELRHYEIWKSYTKAEVKANFFLVLWYQMISLLLGYTFTIKIMEKKQSDFDTPKMRNLLEKLSEHIPDLPLILREEEDHELALIQMIDEERLQYVGSMVLGLNDALVEFTGSLAGWTFAMQSNRLILLAGLITGISATLSMASSEYLSSKNEGDGNALKSAVYTGIAYLITVFTLLLPYALLPNKSFVLALIIMLFLVVVIIAVFNYYISVAKDLVFWSKFKEMSIISLSVAGISFFIGLAVKHFLGIDI